MTTAEMFDVAPARRDPPWSAAASLGLHVAFVAAALLAFPLRPLVVLPPEPVAVEIVTQAQFAALETAPEAPVETPQLTAPATSEATAPAAPGDARLPSEPRVTPAAPSTYRATRFYAAGILKEPGMERIRAGLQHFAAAERVVQLCNIEGLEQIRRVAPQYAPDTLVSYAMADPVEAGLTLTAAGGAFRSRRKWYGISLSCTVGADLESVTSFTFKLGEPIPEAQWEDHNLNAADDDE